MQQGWTVRCDAEAFANGSECWVSDQVSGTKRTAARDFTESGWKRLTGGRWLCPRCAIKLFPKNFIKARRL